MLRRKMLMGLMATAYAGCAAAPVPPVTQPLASNGGARPTAYIIAPGTEAAVQFRMLDSVNAMRATAGLPAVALDPRLNAAAATHARDMAVQNRPWLFGSDGSSPLTRAARVGFPGQLRGENISESFESELVTLTAWMAQPDTRAVILDPQAQVMGIGWFQEPTAKLWWTLNMGSLFPGNRATAAF